MSSYQNNYIKYIRLQKSNNGELNESEERQQMVETIQHLKRAQQLDRKAIDNLTDMVQQLLLSQKGEHAIIINIYVQAGILFVKYKICIILLILIL